MKKSYFTSSYFSDTYIFSVLFQGIIPPCTAQTWNQKANFGGTTRQQAVGFSTGTKGYIGLGHDGSSLMGEKDFWEWDRSTNTWTQKADFGGVSRVSPVAFSMGTRRYIGTGHNGLNYRKDFWEYAVAGFPVTFLRVTAEEKNEGVNILWSTAVEKNNKEFTIEKSKDGLSYQTAGTVPGSGNTNTVKHYTFLDQNPSPGASFYRLKQTDYNDNTFYSGIVEIFINTDAEKQQMVIFPNPVKANKPVFLRYYSDSEEFLSLEIMNKVGQQIAHRTELLMQGDNTISVKTETLDAGIYFVRIKSSTGTSISKLIVVN